MKPPLPINNTTPNLLAIKELFSTPTLHGAGDGGGIKEYPRGVDHNMEFGGGEPSGNLLGKAGADSQNALLPTDRTAERRGLSRYEISSFGVFPMQKYKKYLTFGE